MYVGGVYVLFIYASVFSPNNPSGLGGGFFVVFLRFCFFLLFFAFVGVSFVSTAEFSFYLCSFYEGFTYCSFCLILMVSFVVISLVGRDKGSFFR